MLGGYAGGQAEYRVPFGCRFVQDSDGLPDEQVLLSQISSLPDMRGSRNCNIQPDDIVGSGAVDQLDNSLIRVLICCASRVIAIDSGTPQMAKDQCKAEVLNYEEDVGSLLKEMMGGRGPDACIDAVEWKHYGTGPDAFYDQVKQAVRLEQTDHCLCIYSNCRLSQRWYRVNSRCLAAFIDKMLMVLP